MVSSSFSNLTCFFCSSRCADRGGDGEANTTGVAAIVPFVLCCARLPMANFDGGNHLCLIPDTPAIAARFPAHIGILHKLRAVMVRPGQDRIGGKADGAELAEDAESGFVARQTKLTLELHRRHAGRLTDDGVGSPEPDAEGRMTALHHRTNGQSCVLATFAAAQDARAVIETEWLSASLTVRANETAVPAGLFKIGSGRPKR